MQPVGKARELLPVPYARPPAHQRQQAIPCSWSQIGGRERGRERGLIESDVSCMHHPWVASTWWTGGSQTLTSKPAQAARLGGQQACMQRQGGAWAMFHVAASHSSGRQQHQQDRWPPPTRIEGAPRKAGPDDLHQVRPQ